MPTVTFLRDFQGRASREIYYLAGTVIDLPGGIVAALLAEGVVEVADSAPPVEAGAGVSLPPAPAVIVHKPMPEPEPPPKPARKRAAKKAVKRGPH